MYTLNEFITYLKLSKAYTTKQLIVIDYIAIYIADACVYKVIIAVNPTMIKKAKKLGLNQFKTIYFDKPAMLNITDGRIAHGKYIIMYYPNAQAQCNYQIYSGEVTESEQLKLI